MPNRIHLSPPPASLNTPETRELYSYIFKLVEQLNIILAEIDRRDDGR